MQRDVNFVCVDCYIFANFSQTPTSTSNLCIFEKPMKRRFQRYIVCTVIMSTFHARVKYISVKNTSLKPMGQWGTKPQKPTLSVEEQEFPSSTSMPGPTHSPRRTTDRSVHTLPHNYATKLHWLQWDAPNSPIKLPFDDHHTHQHTHPSTDPTHHPNGIRIQWAVLPQYSFRTDRQTDRWARRQVRKISVYARLIESDALIMN